MATPSLDSSSYQFERGFPTPDTAQRAYDDADLNRAIQAYRFFFPTVTRGWPRASPPAPEP